LHTFRLRLRNLPDRFDQAPRVRLHHVGSDSFSARCHHRERTAWPVRIQPDIPVHDRSPAGYSQIPDCPAQRENASCLIGPGSASNHLRSRTRCPC